MSKLEIKKDQSDRVQPQPDNHLRCVDHPALDGDVHNTRYTGKYQQYEASLNGFHTGVA